MLDGFSQSQLPQNNLISMEFPLGRLVTWCRKDRGISIQLLSRLRESETGRSRSPNGSMTTLQSSVARRKGAGKSRGSKLGVCRPLACVWHMSFLVSQIPGPICFLFIAVFFELPLSHLFHPTFTKLRTFPGSDRICFDFVNSGQCNRTACSFRHPQPPHKEEERSNAGMAGQSLWVHLTAAMV